MTDAPSTDDPLFTELAIRYFDGVADAEDVARLTQMLEADQQRCEQFVWLSYQSGLMAHLGQSAPEVLIDEAGHVLHDDHAGLQAWHSIEELVQSPVSTAGRTDHGQVLYPHTLRAPSPAAPRPGR